MKTDNKELIKQMKNIYELPTSKNKIRFIRNHFEVKLSLFTFLKNQFKLINKKIYISSFVYFIVLLILLLNSHNEQYIFLSAGISYFSLLIVGTVSSSSMYKTEELEMSTLYSLKMVIIARFLILSFITVLFIGIMSIFTLVINKISLIKVLCYFFIPYFLNMYIDLKLLQKYKSNGLKYCFVVSSIICLLIISCISFSKLSLLLNENILIVFNVLLIILLIREIINYLNRIEDYVWNL